MHHYMLKAMSRDFSLLRRTKGITLKGFVGAVELVQLPCNSHVQDWIQLKAYKYDKLGQTDFQ